MGVIMRILFHLSVLLFVGASACKPQGNSKLSAVATSKSLKTGFFIPKIQSDLAYGKPTRISDPMVLMEKIGFQFSRAPGEYYRVATTADSENILVLLRPNRAPAPLVSLDATGRKYFWSSMNVADENSGIRFESNLFVKHPISEEPSLKVAKDGNSSNIFFTRFPNTEEGGREPILVNWVDHILADNSTVLFRVGNLVYLAGADHPILRYQEIGNQVWVMDGKYKDRDVEKGTVFWTADGQKYFSMNPRSDQVVEWRKQDKDSMEVVGRKTSSSVKVPDIVTRTVAANKETGLSLTDDNRQGYFGMDWSKLSKGTTPLIQHDELLKQQSTATENSQSGFSLAGGPQTPDENSPDFDQFFEPAGTPKLHYADEKVTGGFSLQGHQRNTPRSGAARGPGPLPGLPIFNPSTGYPYGWGEENPSNWVQVEQPPGSGIYKAAVVQQQGNTTRKVDGIFWDSEVNQRKHSLQIMEPVTGGGYRANGQVANLVTEGNRTVNADWSHIQYENARARANADREAAAAAAAKEKFKFESGRGSAHMAAGDASYKDFEKMYTVNDNLKWAAGEAIGYAVGGANKAASQRDLVFPKPTTFTDRFAEEAAGQIIKGGANAAAGYLVDLAVGPVGESKPFSAQGTAKSLLDSTARTLAGSAAKHYFPVKLPDGLTKDALEAGRGVLTKWGYDGVKAGGVAGYDYVTKPAPQTAAERGRAAGERQANMQGLGWMAAGGVTDATFHVAKNAARANPLLYTTVAVGERGTKMAMQGGKTAASYSSANSAYLDANQALKPWEQHLYNNGHEGQGARARMDAASQSGKVYRPALPSVTTPSSSTRSSSVTATPSATPTRSSAGSGGQR